MTNNYLCNVIVLISTLFVQTERAYAAKPEPEIAKSAQAITVLIETPASAGSGVILERHKEIYSVITAKHVINSINKNEEAYIVTPDEEKNTLIAKTVHKLPDVDLAIVEFSSKKDYKTAEIGNPTKATSGTRVYIAGFPLPTAAINRAIFNFTKGEITAQPPQSLKDGYRLVYNNNTLPGMSGGPIFNDDGQLIGIHGRADRQTNQATDNPDIVIKTGFNLGIPIPKYLEKHPGFNYWLLLSLIPLFLAGRGLYSLLRRYLKDKYSVSHIESAQTYFEQATTRYNLGDYKEAIQYYSQALRLNPNLTQGYLMRGNTLLQIGNEQAAIADYSQALRLDPKYIHAYLVRGDALFRLGDYQAATEDYTQTILLDYKCTTAYNSRANACASLGRFELAIEDYTQAILLDPKFKDAYLGRADANYNLGNFQNALADYNQVLILDSEHFIAYNKRGNTKSKLGDFRGAVEDYNQALNLNINYTDVYLGRGNALYNLEEFPEAIKDYSKALVLNPYSAEIYYNRGISYIKLGYQIKGQEDVKKAISIAKKQRDKELYKRLSQAFEIISYSKIGKIFDR